MGSYGRVSEIWFDGAAALQFFLSPVDRRREGTTGRMPPGCDVWIRLGWFWRRNETAKPLLEIYYNSIGHNCVLLLNASPNTKGVVEDADVARLREFGRAVYTIFGTDWAPTEEDGRRNGYWIGLRRRRTRTGLWSSAASSPTPAFLRCERPRLPARHTSSPPPFFLLELHARTTAASAFGRNCSQL
ncbi:unnamed protein product, partial [Urochloa humidicola]